MPEFTEQQFSFKRPFERDADLAQYGDNALLVFALGLYLLSDDFDELAAESLTDGADDKKIDACHIDISDGRLVVAQGYFAQEWGRPAAPANKASDLNTAVTWLISADIASVPERIRPKAEEVRRAVSNGEIKRFDVLYIHNCFESTNVADEMRAVANTARDLLVQVNPETITVNYRELGLESIQSLYDALDKPILVEDEFSIATHACLTQSADGWDSIVATVPGRFFRSLHETHGEKLFSANLRDFLGITRHRGNINAGIQQTAASEGYNFWVFNNGVTALTNNWENRDGQLKIEGISIINGAQTCGALGSCDDSELDDVFVLCRFVKCADNSLVERIIKYNNTQNVIRPSDLRSNNPVQKKLEREFSELEIPYVIRRSAGRTQKHAISVEGIAPSLCAFHGHPQTASRNKREIFENDSTFQDVFPSAITPEHIYLVNCFSLAFDSLKLTLKELVSSLNATELQESQYEVMKYSMSKYFILYIVGECAEEILNTKVPSKVAWRAKRSIVTLDPRELQECCIDVLRTLVPLISTQSATLGAPYDVTRSMPLTRQVAQALRGVLASLEPSLGNQFSCIRQSSVI